MADIKISQLDTLTSVDSTDVLVVNDLSAATTKQAAISTVLDLTSRNIYDSGSTAVIRSDLNVENEIIAGGDITTETGTLAFGRLKDITENVVINKFVDDSDRIVNNINNTSIPTSGAVYDLVSEVAGLAGTILVDSANQATTLYPLLIGTVSGTDSVVADSAFNYNSLSRTLTVGNINPAADSVYDLGSPSAKWRDLYLSGTTLNIGNFTLKDIGGEAVFSQAISAPSFDGDGSLLSGITYDYVADSAQGRSVKLVPTNGQVIRYDSAGNENDTLQFSVETDGFQTTYGVTQFQFEVKPAGGAYAIRQAQSSVNTFTLPDVDEPNVNSTAVVKVIAYENQGAGYIAKASDYVTVYGLVNGTAVTGFLTNEAHTEPADSAGNLTTGLEDAGGTFKVFVGTVEVTTDPSVTFAVDSESGIDLSINSSTGVYTLNSFNSIATVKGSGAMTATVPQALIPGAGSNFEINKVYTVNKNIQGARGQDGADGIDGIDGIDAVGADGANGVNAKAVKLLPLNGQVIRYDSAEQEFDTLTFRAIQENLDSSQTFHFEIKNSNELDTGYVSLQNTADSDFTLPDGNEPDVNGVKVLRLTASDATGVVAQDTVSIYGLQNGTSITGFLTNEVHVEPAESDGSLSTPLTDAGGTFRVFLGTRDISSDPLVTYSNTSNTGVNGTINSNGVYTVTSFASLGTLKGQLDFRATVDASLVPGSGQDYPIDKTYSISKSIKGIKGVDGADGIDGIDAVGTPGADGTNAHVVKLEPISGQVIRYEEDGTTETDTLKFNSTPEGFSGLVTYDFSTKIPGGSYTIRQSQADSSEYVLADNLEPTLASPTTIIRVRAYDSNSSNIFAEDYVTTYALANGAGVTAFLTNETHAEPADSNGNLKGSLDDAGGTFKVFVGTIDVTTGSGVTYAVDSENAGACNIAINSSTGVYSVSSFAADFSNPRLQATVPSSLLPGGTSNMLIDKIYTINKTRDGVRGTPGAGTTGSKLAQEGYVYYTQTSASVPASPDDGVSPVFSFSTSSFNTLATNWQQEALDFTTANTDGVYWASRYTVQETIVGGGTGTPTFSAPFRSYNFDGLVTFTNLASDLETTGGSITTIDGGLINTGTINAGLVNIQYDSSAGTTGGLNIRSGTTGARLEMTGSRLDIFDSAGVLRVRLGKLS